MPSIPIDVPLPDNVKAFLARPKCADIALPAPGKVELRLPLGGTIKGMTDVTKGIPDDCALTFSLLLQLGPILASIECLVKLLGLIKPLVAVIEATQSLPDMRKLLSAIPEFLDAAAKLTPCIEAVIIPPIAIIPFIKDLLCLIIKLIHCMSEQLKSIASVMGGLQLSIQSATEAGNTDLLEQLKCAQENAASSAAHVMTGMDPIMMILGLAEPFFGLADVPVIKIPSLGSASDMESLNQVIATLDDVVNVLKLAAEPLGGC